MRILISLALVLCACNGGNGGNDDDTGGNPSATGDVRLDGGDALGSDPDSYDLQFCASGDTLAVAWVDDRSGTLDVWVNASSDGGATWLAEPVSPSNSSGDAHDPSLACNGTDVYLAWEDTRGSELGDDGVWFARSSNSGASWGQPVALTADADTEHDANSPHIAADGPNVLLAWAANPGGGYDIYAAASQDGGVSFGSPTRVESDTAGASYSARPKAAIVDAASYVLWEDRRTGIMTIRAAKSTDDGVSFGADVAVSNDASGDALNVDVATDGDATWLTWHQGPIGDRLDVFASWAVTSDSSFSTPMRISGGDVGERDDLRPRVAADGGAVQFAWYSESGGGYHVFVRGTADGATFSEPFRVDNAEDAARSERPAIGAGGGAFVVGWEDDRDSSGGDTRELYMASTKNDGEYWEDESRIGRVARGIAVASDLQIATDGTYAYAAWIDNRLGTADVYFTANDVPEAPTPDTGGAR
ncbi:MAG: exo-alpha-sialidase [Deltaproteobacteria bacterium]|nr:MAG: exo-alpha-sialidase [Deltaproteobacteria bacterium]